MSQPCACDLVCPCPPIGIIDVVGKKWAVCVISLLGKYETVRFGSIQRCLSGVSPATLTSTLRSLERARLIRRTTTGAPKAPLKAYALTPTGTQLYRALMPLANWLRSE